MTKHYLLMDMLQQIIQLVTILFLLSMVCERIADFFKHYLSDSYLFKIQKEFFKVGDTLTKFPKDDAKEQERTFRILKINVWSGVILSLILKADLIKIFNNITDPTKALGWNNLKDYKENIDWILLPFGIILTGCFISFGSKFWHDLLDILYQIKNTKRVLANSETYKTENTKNFEKLSDTYQSDFIKLAYQEASTRFLAMPRVKAIGIKNDDKGYYFEITVSQYEPLIGDSYQYFLEDGTSLNIRIKIIELHEDDRIIPHGINLSSKIFDLDVPDKYGTLGVMVKPINGDSDKRYLLTCCHNVVHPLRAIPDLDQKQINTGTIDSGLISEIGTVVKAGIDHEMDAALIEIIPGKQIINVVPKMGAPQKARQLLNQDVGKVTAFMYGAKTGVNSGNVSKGTVTSVYQSVKILHGDQELSFINLIEISDNGQAISEPGDSGSCVLDSNNDILGIVVAGYSKKTYVIPINTLLIKLNVQLA